MIQEPFASGNSFLHKIDPRFKIFFATLFSCFIAVLNQFSALYFALIISIILIFMAKLNLWLVLRRIAVMWGFLILLWLVLPLTFEGEIFYKIGSIALTRPGIMLCAKITLKSNSILLIFMALVATMNFNTLGYVLNYFKIPEKMVYLLLLTYRYIFVIEQEYQRLIRAAKMRSFQPKTSLHTYKTYAYLIGMLFVRASSRANRVYRAMQCRGFNGKFYCLQQFSISLKDWYWSIFMFICIKGLIILEFINVK